MARLAGQLPRENREKVLNQALDFLKEPHEKILKLATAHRMRISDYLNPGGKNGPILVAIMSIYSPVRFRRPRREYREA